MQIKPFLRHHTFQMRVSRIDLVAFSFFMIIGAALAVNAQSRRVTPKPTPTPQDENLRIVTEEIKLNVLAFDEQGNFFRDVTDRDLVITENNILHQPASVRRLPANVLIVMDTGGELRAVKNLDQTRKVARAVVESLRPGDSLALMQYSDKPEIVSEWTNDKTQLDKAINHTTFGRRSQFVDAIRMATEFLMRDPLENKHLVLITDGTDSQGKSSEKFDAFQHLLATDISVHVISYTAMESADIEPRTKTLSNATPKKALPDEVVNQLPNDVKIANQRPKVGPTINMDRTMLKQLKARKLDLDISQEQLEKLSEGSNGEFILPVTTDEMVEKAPLVAKMIDASYVVTYTPKISVVETRGIAERNIEVTSKRPGLIVVARRRLIIDHSR